MTNLLIKKNSSGQWVVEEDDVEYPVHVVVGDSSFCILDPWYTFSLTLWGVKYVFDITDKQISNVFTIVDRPDGPIPRNVAGVTIPIGHPSVNFFSKTRVVDGIEDTCYICHKWNRQIYKSF